MPEKQKLKNKGYYIGNLCGKIQEQRLQDNRTRVSFVSLASSIVTFVETLGSHLKDAPSFCYCTYVLQVSSFLRNLPLMQRYFCVVYDFVEKSISQQVRAIRIQKENWG